MRCGSKEKASRPRRFGESSRSEASPITWASLFLCEARGRLWLPRLREAFERRRRPPDPFIDEPRGPRVGGIQEVATVDDERVAHQLAHLRRRKGAEIVPLGHDYGGIGSRKRLGQRLALPCALQKPAGVGDRVPGAH